MSGVNSMVSSLQDSLNNALRSMTSGANATKSADVKSTQQDVTKSSLNVKAMATDLGSIVKDKTRLNLVSTLGKTDPVDFYKFSATSSGTMSLGRVGDAGIRFQMMDKTGNVIADSADGQGSASDNYTKLKAGQLSVDKGDYTVRITRDKDVSLMDEKDYAFQLQMGTFSEDHDTVARQSDSGSDSGSSYLSILNGSSASGTTNNLIALLSGDTSQSSSSDDLASLLSGGGRGQLINGLF